MSRQKAKGTRYESAVRNYMAEALGDARIERRALHGAQDMGDLYGIRAHGFEGIAECKSHRTVTPGLVERWRDETLCERGNADAGFALLVIDVYRAPVERSEVHVTLRDLARICPALDVADGMDDAADSEWAVLTLGDACRMIGG
ncbi:hypothetical protein H6A18_09560 [Collinsella tanakaei]|uniref:hypothetical protein n=1 Tax=Collinsella tanakaei TaxID=626935 RepID=UPI001959F117|nr:hypothetical protein [Collinsella tanakaei]MBM6756748.1 hypothetical protein [Collinsella tanakaei]